MVKKQDPDVLLSKINDTYKETGKRKSAIVQYEKTAASRLASIEKLASGGKEKIDATVSEYKTRLEKESNLYKTDAKLKLKDVETLRTLTLKDRNLFTRTYDTAMNKKNGIEVKHSKVTRLTNEVIESANIINKHEIKTRNTNDQVSTILSGVKKNEKTISEIHDQAIIINEAIQETYALTTDTTMSGSLIERRDALKTRTDTWQKWYLISIAAIIGALVLALVSLLMNTDVGLVQLISERLILVTPLIVVSFVLARQFGHERKLYEEYAFKAAAAQTLRGYTILLNEQFKDMPGARQDILDFTIRAMDGIYNREPLVQSPTFVHLIVGNHLAKIEAKLDDRTVIATASDKGKSLKLSSTITAPNETV